MTKFEDRLISDLIEEHGSALATVERPVSRRRSGRPLWIAVGAVAIAGVTAIGITLVGGGSTPAYAVTQNPNGTVTLTLNELSGIDGANQRLHQLGLPVVVVPAEADCTAPSPRGQDLSGDYMRHEMTAIQTINSNGVTFDVRDIPAGDTLMVTGGSAGIRPSERPGGVVWMIEALIKGPAPSCVLAPSSISVTSGGPRPSAPVATPSGN